MNHPTSRYGWRLPVWLALAGIVVAALLELACPTLAEAQDSRPPVSITVTPRQGLAPLVSRVTVTIPMHPENVEICLHMDGPLRGNTSCHPHQGTGAQPQKVSQWTLPQGTYLFWAVIHREQNKSFTSNVVTVEVR